jgi:hypothetical protein
MPRHSTQLGSTSANEAAMIEQSVQRRSVRDSFGHLLSVWVFALVITALFVVLLRHLADVMAPKVLDLEITMEAPTAITLFIATYALALAIARFSILRGIDELETRRWRRFWMAATVGAVASLTPSVLFATAGEDAAVRGIPWLYVIFVLIGLPTGGGAAFGYFNISIHDARDKANVLAILRAASASGPETP